MSGFSSVPHNKLFKMINMINGSREVVKTLIFGMINNLIIFLLIIIVIFINWLIFLDDEERKFLVSHANILYKICPKVESVHLINISGYGNYYYYILLYYYWLYLIVLIIIAGVVKLVTLLKNTLKELNNYLGVYLFFIHLLIFTFYNNKTTSQSHTHIY